MPKYTRSAPPIFIYLTVALIALTGAEGKGCKACDPSDPSDEPPVEDTDVDDVADVGEELQVVSLSPSYRAAGEAFDARLDGAGFVSGTTVTIGESIAPQSLKFVSDNELRLRIPILDAGGYDVTAENPDGAKSVLRRGLVLTEPVDQGNCGFVRVHFDTDKAGLNDASKRLLDDNADCFGKRNRIRIEGHADERGTTEYNLGLGERRAHAVSRYLVSKGVSAHNHDIVSLGEERPVDPTSSQAAWSKNRRVDIHAD